jgi:hypothetical protein
MRHVFLIAFFLLPFRALSQETQEKIIYLNENGAEVAKEAATFFRKISPANGAHLVRDYYAPTTGARIVSFE